MSAGAPSETLPRAIHHNRGAVSDTGTQSTGKDDSAMGDTVDHSTTHLYRDSSIRMVRKSMCRPLRQPRSRRSQAQYNIPQGCRA